MSYTCGAAELLGVDLGRLEAVPDFHEHVFVPDFEPLELDLAVPAVLFRPHDGNRAHDAPARLVGVEEERG